MSSGQESINSNVEVKLDINGICFHTAKEETSLFCINMKPFRLTLKSGRGGRGVWHRDTWRRTKEERWQGWGNHIINSNARTYKMVEPCLCLCFTWNYQRCGRGTLLALAYPQTLSKTLLMTNTYLTWKHSPMLTISARLLDSGIIGAWAKGTASHQVVPDWA